MPVAALRFASSTCLSILLLRRRLIICTSTTTKMKQLSVPASCSHKKGDKLKGAVGSTTSNYGQSTAQEVTESYVEIETIRSDPGRLSAMTVKELRTLTRSIGISSKGTKKDLVSALIKSYQQKDEDVKVSREAKPELPKSMPSKRKSKASLTGKALQNVITVSEVTESKQKRSRREQHSFEITSSKSHSRNFSCQKLPADSLEATGTNQIPLQVDPGEPWTMLAHKKPQAGWVAYNPTTMRPPHITRDVKFVKLLSWNVNGLRALLKARNLSMLQLAEKEDFDVLCLQETKMKENDIEEIKDCLIEGYGNNFWNCSISKLGYSGSAIISRIKPISVKYGLGLPDHDSEGRLITVEFDAFYLINAYVPNSGDGLKRLTYRVKEWDSSLSRYLKDLELSKPVILTGDLNCAHEEIDIYNPAGNRRSAGFTWEERESFEMNFLSKGFVDTFRKQHPGVVAYTYWGYRHGGRKSNKGWRLDYFLVSEGISNKAYDSYILPNVEGSDHCPVGLILKV